MYEKKCWSANEKSDFFSKGKKPKIESFALCYKIHALYTCVRNVCFWKKYETNLSLFFRFCRLLIFDSRWFFHRSWLCRFLTVVSMYLCACVPAANNTNFLYLKTESISNATVADPCQDYVEIERKLQCGKFGYPIAYAHHYCKKFSEHKSKFSPEGQNFVNCTRESLKNHAKSFLEKV